eukprot:403332869
MHCIYKWLETHDDCPLDRVKWSEKISNVENQPPSVQQQQQQQLQQQQPVPNDRVLGIAGNIRQQFGNNAGLGAAGDQQQMQQQQQQQQFIVGPPQNMQFSVNSNQIGGGAGAQGFGNFGNGQQQM